MDSATNECIDAQMLQYQFNCLKMMHPSKDEWSLQVRAHLFNRFTITKCKVQLVLKLHLNFELSIIALKLD